MTKQELINLIQVMGSDCIAQGMMIVKEKKFVKNSSDHLILTAEMRKVKIRLESQLEIITKEINEHFSESRIVL